jgi:CSLREA domain-containing protein
MPLFPSSAFKALPFAVLSTTALATDFVVTTGQDEFDGICDAHCSLRDAVQAANAQAGPDRVLLNSTYVLSRPAAGDGSPDEDDNQNGDLDVRDELVVRGQGEERTEIRGEGLNDRIFEVLPGARLALERLKISGGDSSSYGGALENHGDAVLSRVTLSDNQAAARREDNPANGGAIANFGTLGVFSSTLVRNQARGHDNPSLGGTLYNQGKLVVRDSLFKDGIAISLNADGLGGAMYNIGLADIARSSFIGNWVPEAGRASAILNEQAGVLKVTNSTFSDNISLSPVILNKAPSPAGTPSIELIHVTMVDNLGPAVENSGRLRIRNSLMAGNWDEDGEYAGACWNFGERYQFEAVGLLLGTDSGTCTADLYIDDAQTLTHLVHPLSAVDGRTYVHALRKNSLALDAGIGSCPRQDQRRRPRPRDGDGDGVAVCDLGAYERARP